MGVFVIPSVLAVLVVALATGFAGWQIGFITAMLAVMEVSLSFDNAVVNATVLRHMSSRWQQRFLTWGILVAVFGMRLLFPVLIVAVAANMGFIETIRLALNSADEFAQHIHSAHIQIESFGGMFLLMVFLKFLFDKEKETHWLGFLERKASEWGGREALELFLAIIVLLTVQNWLLLGESLMSLQGGLLGLATFIGVELVGEAIGGEEVAGKVVRTGISAFIYLEVLDASFSFDGVIGAFAVSHNILVIMAGLGVGALFIRSLTIFLVRKGVLESYIYLEHGAHYGIGALAVIMLVSMFSPVPEVITGLVGLSFIALSFWSSLLHNRRQK